MITRTIERDGILQFHEPVTRTARAIMALGGVVPLLAPYELLVRPTWYGFSLMMIPVLAICAGALAISVLFLTTAVLGMARTATFDPEAKRLMLEARGLLGRRRVQRIAFRDLGSVAVVPEQQADGPIRFRLKIAVRDRQQRLDLDTFDDPDSAEDARTQIRQVLGGPVLVGPILGWARPPYPVGEEVDPPGR